MNHNMKLDAMKKMNDEKEMNHQDKMLGKANSMYHTAENNSRQIINGTNEGIIEIRCW